MPPSKKSRREETSTVPKTPILSMLPTDILLDIVARFNLRTFVRCAATCKLLRRDLLSPPFICCISRAAPCILANFHADASKPLTLIHPKNPAVASFCHKHMSRFLSRKGVGTLHGEYTPISSRRGFILLQRPNLKYGTKSYRGYDLCIYDPMSGTLNYFSSPQEIWNDSSWHKKYVILTAADGIDCSFLLLVFDICSWKINLHTASTSCTRWSASYGSDNDFPWSSLKERGEPAILHGGVIHWIACLGKQILSYNFGNGKKSSLKLPPLNCDVNYQASNLYLATSADRKLLKLLSIQGFVLFVWLHRSVSSIDGSGWSLETVIDMEENLRSLDPIRNGCPVEHVQFEGSGNRTGDVVLLKVVSIRDYGHKLVVFDLEAKKMHIQKRVLTLLEIDLPYRLQTMKTFS